MGEFYAALMHREFFVSYSRVDGADFALRLADELETGPPSYGVWLDVRHMRPGHLDWDRQLVNAIKTCAALLFVMTGDSVRDESGCKPEWVAALRYKRPVIPLRVEYEVELPFRLSSRQFVDFSDSFGAGLAELRRHLRWAGTDAGVLQDLRYRVADAEYELPRAQPEQRRRIEEELGELRRQVAERQRAKRSPEAVAREIDTRIGAGIQRERQSGAPVEEPARTTFVNRPPLTAPGYFQDRHVETELLGAFLREEGLRMMSVVGRGGVGKTAMVCRLLKALERGRLPDDLGELLVNGIVYLSPLGAHPVNFPNLFGDLCRVLPEDVAESLLARYRDPQATPAALMRTLLEAFPGGPTVVFLDNFEDVVDNQTFALTDAVLDEALRALLSAPVHGVKVIITTRVAPRALLLTQPGVQRRLDLDEGLPSPFAEQLLRACDPDGRLGVRDAPAPLLVQARERTRGFPRALEALVAILAADRDTTLPELLVDAEQIPENVVEALVGEAFSRLDPLAQQVMQALAIYPSAMPPVAVDYLLQPFQSAIDSAPILSRLVNMSFARRDAGHYYLHQVDRDYALRRIAVGEPDDGAAESPAFTQHALRRRAADYFAQMRTPPETWHALSDLSPQLAEFELRCQAGEYDKARTAVRDIHFNCFDYLLAWGHYELAIELHERLEGHLANKSAATDNASELANCYYLLGQTQRAIELYEWVLATERNVPASEAATLSDLGRCYVSLGDMRQGIEFYERALAIHQRLGIQSNEAVTVGCLAWAYVKLGQTGRAIELHERALMLARESSREIKIILSPDGGAATMIIPQGRRIEAESLRGLGVCSAAVGETRRAIELHQQALAIARELGERLDEAEALCYLGDCHADMEAWKQARESYNQAILIADEIGVPTIRSEARLGLAAVQLVSGELDSAGETAQAAKTDHDPLTAADRALILGIALTRQDRRDAAGQAFTDAVRSTRALLELTRDNYHALDIQALARCGQALDHGGEQLVAEASVMFRAARAVTRAPGIVRRILRLLNALVPADTRGILEPIHRAAAGEDP